MSGERQLKFKLEIDCDLSVFRDMAADMGHVTGQHQGTLIEIASCLHQARSQIEKLGTPAVGSEFAVRNRGGAQVGRFWFEIAE
jgi:hypothetical protein